MQTIFVSFGVSFSIKFCREIGYSIEFEFEFEFQLMFWNWPKVKTKQWKQGGSTHKQTRTQPLNLWFTKPLNLYSIWITSLFDQMFTHFSISINFNEPFCVSLFLVSVYHQQTDRSERNTKTKLNRNKPNKRKIGAHRHSPEKTEQWV